MEANELRIGNFVGDIGNIPYQVYPQTILSLWQMEISGKIPLDVNPIPLTEEWLVKFGFTKSLANGTIYCKARFMEIIYDSDIYLSFSGNRGKLNIKHVHQLQNLYFALTGEELIAN